MDQKQPTWASDEQARIARFELDDFSQTDARKAEELRSKGIDAAKQGDFTLAGQLILRSLSMFLAAGGPQHPEVGQTYADLGGGCAPE